jgi:hypothetical protein
VGAWFGASPNLSLLVPFGAPEKSDGKSPYGRSARFPTALFWSIGKRMLPLVEDLDVTKLHVQAPTEIVFLCGGPFTPLNEVAGTLPKSMRDAFLRVAKHPALGDREIVLAEDFTKLSVFSAHYRDILEFESDLAQITELIILFCESAGSFAELGSFASVEEIAKRLLVVLRDLYANANSFITLGPVTNLRNHHEYSVFIIEDEVIGIVGESHAAINLSAFKSAMDEPLRLRLERTKEPTTFDSRRAGHIIKLVVGLIQEYGALKLSEIEETLIKLGVLVPKERLLAFLLCAQTVGWVTSEIKGFDEYFVALAGEDAANFTLPETATVKNRRRRRLLIRDHWEKSDPARFRAISKVAGVAAGE